MTESNYDNPSLSFELNLDVVNQLLILLGDQPYKQSAGIINLIMLQVQPQIEKIQAERNAREQLY